MAVEVNWTSLSLDDIEKIAGFIANDSQYYALLQTERFFERVKLLETQPEIGRIVPEIGSKSIRQLVEGNYRIIYRVISSSRIDILTVHHKSRLLSNNPLFEE
jgi:plasmid stabilization system protein ParE